MHTSALEVHQCGCTTLQHLCTLMAEQAKIQHTQPCHPLKLGIYRKQITGYKTGAKQILPVSKYGGAEQIPSDVAARQKVIIKLFKASLRVDIEGSRHLASQECHR